MPRLSLRLTPLVLSLALGLNPLPVFSKPNILPGDSAKHLPQLSQATIEKRAQRKEQRAQAREEKRLKRLRKNEKASN